MKTSPFPKIKDNKPMFDPHYEAACRRVKAAAQELIDKGIVDAQGRRIRTDLPPDMEPGAERDFGG